MGRVVNRDGDSLWPLGRVQVRVPHVYGTANEADGISDADLPWAIPFGMPNGATTKVGGMSWVPDKGAQVAVMFLDGDPDQPMYTPTMQPLENAAENPVHAINSYGQREDGLIITNNGHVTAYRPGEVTTTTKNGTGVLMIDKPSRKIVLGAAPAPNAAGDEALPSLPGLDDGSAASEEKLGQVNGAKATKIEAGQIASLTGVEVKDKDWSASLSYERAGQLLDDKFIGTESYLGPYPKNSNELADHPYAAEIGQQYKQLFVRAGNDNVTGTAVPVTHLTDGPPDQVGLSPAVYESLKVTTQSSGEEPVASDPNEGFVAHVTYGRPKPDSSPDAPHR